MAIIPGVTLASGEVVSYHHASLEMADGGVHLVLGARWRRGGALLWWSGAAVWLPGEAECDCTGGEETT